MSCTARNFSRSSGTSFSLTGAEKPRSNDGTGGADFSRGTGLVGLKDRVEALGGRISVHSPRGAGTTVRAELPLTVSDHSGR